jgi:short-subunit dehydrogenase
MNIAVTGHTSGIGLAIFNAFAQANHNVVGFSRTNGYDIGDSIDSILEQSLHCDMFVNNAYHEFGQNKILEKLLTYWKGTDKYIINISSNIVNMHSQFPDTIEEYKRVKQISNQIVNNYSGSVNVLNVLPDVVKTNFYLGGSLLELGMDPKYVADTIIKEVRPGVHELIIRHPDW